MQKKTDLNSRNLVKLARQHRRERPAKKFMLVINPPMYQILRGAAEEKGINVQELLRAVVIPEWLHASNASREGLMSGDSFPFLLLRTFGPTQVL